MLNNNRYSSTRQSKPVLAIAIWGFLATALACDARAAELSGDYTGGGGYVFRFEQSAQGYTGRVVEWSTGRAFRIDDIRIEAERVSFFVVHDAHWDEEVRANGGKAFRMPVRRLRERLGAGRADHLGQRFRRGRRDGLRRAERCQQATHRRPAEAGAVHQPQPGVELVVRQPAQAEGIRAA